MHSQLFICFAFHLRSNRFSWTIDKRLHAYPDMNLHACLATASPVTQTGYPIRKGCFAKITPNNDPGRNANEEDSHAEFVAA
ncbi:hypothetical protein CEXT_589721 [Caerostris extrusa]|uniref:Uncharacterized protein n=1 Tax=Caerostris extrusa TaxID=172846 RepID=A0AAV4NXL5_CAEEX|nr:hypothetical protein CEXT_589721 [Caerostris extrusa]